ncbi:hypothetical protein BB561_001027 [Smittium simulii]|uniref:ABC transporter domain-containing protein n=1 Tax=Smittium simulii TaxID=133385 RepID=A0A2T9YWI5_9FUNG|nr:hypothetical protein BB561_001027 [Smittium simulii]
MKEENNISREARNSLDSTYNDIITENRKSYQFRALVRNKLSYQRRQWKTNVFCVSFCPFMMAAIGAIIGIIINSKFKTDVNSSSYYMCANVNASNSLNYPMNMDHYSSFVDDPEYSYDDKSKIDGSKIPNGLPRLYQAINYYILPKKLTDMASSANDISAGGQSCAWIFDKDYPFSAPYQADPEVPYYARLDTITQPDLLGGWFGTKAISNHNITVMANQRYSWMFVADLSNTGLAGSRNEIPTIPFDKTIKSNNSSKNISYIQELMSSNYPKLINSSDVGTGILGKTNIRYYLDYFSNPNNKSLEGPIGIKPVPWYSPSGKTSLTEIDDLILEYISSAVKDLQKIPQDVVNIISGNITRKFGDESYKYKYFDSITPISNRVPWGAIIFEKIDTKTRNYKYTLQIGTNDRMKAAGIFSSVIEKMIIQQSSIGTALLRSSSENPNANIVHQLRAMPQLYYDESSISIGSLIGSTLYPFGISFIISVFVLILVKEKEDRILVMMRMNGLKYYSYYLTHYAHFLILSILTNSIFLITGIGFRMELFIKTSLGVLILLLFIWGNVQVALSFFFSTLFKQYKFAQIMVSIVILWGIIIDTAVSFIFTAKTPIGYLIWPPLAMYRAISKLNDASTSTIRPGYRFKDLVPGDEVFTSMVALCIEWVVLMALAFYLNMILSSDYGVKKPWHFIFSDFMKKKPIPTNLTSYGEDELLLEDADVKAERDRVLNNELKHSPLVLRRVRKVYNSGKVAVKDVTFSVEKDTIFGLLGPNGAGKTTTISMMSGLFPISSGYATLAGFDVNTETQQVYRHVGICPQHDILWDDLSIEDHLYFYARLKGISPKDEKESVLKIIESVGFVGKNDKLSKELSGGQKRRLSIAIALVGNPDVVFLDEPTTGLDPEVRRSVWNLISSNKKGRTIVITTHSMEEAEVLCGRIGIMSHGTMRCIGSNLRLKQLYGSGFLVSVACPQKFLPGAKAFIESLLPSNAKILDNFINAASWEFKPEPEFIPHLYRIISSKAKDFHIVDWGISQTSLDEVFLRIIGDDVAAKSD